MRTLQTVFFENKLVEMFDSTNFAVAIISYLQNQLLRALFGTYLNIYVGAFLRLDIPLGS